jgi:hypothetical protein
VPDRRIEELESLLAAHAAGMRPRPEQGWAKVRRRMRRHQRQRIATLATAAAAAVVLAVFVAGVLPGSDPAPRPVTPAIEPATSAPAPTVTTTTRPAPATTRPSVATAPEERPAATSSTRRPGGAATTTTGPKASAVPDVYQVDPVPAGSGKEIAMYGVGCPVGTAGQSLRVSLHHVETGYSFVNSRTVIDGTGDDGRYLWRAFARPSSDAPAGPYRLKVRCSAAGLYDIGGTFEGVAPSRP